MKVLAITTIPSGLDLQKNGVRYIDATLIDSETGEILDEYNSGILRLPLGIIDEIPLEDHPDDQLEGLVEYREAAERFQEFMSEITLEYESDPSPETRITVVLDQDAGWINLWLSYNGLEHIELTTHGKRIVIDYYSWLSGIELWDISRIVPEKFDNSLELARAFVNNNKKRLENKQTIHHLVEERNKFQDCTAHLRYLFGAFFMFGCVFGHLCF